MLTGKAEGFCLCLGMGRPWLPIANFDCTRPFYSCEDYGRPPPCWWKSDFSLTKLPTNLTLRTGCSAQDYGQTIGGHLTVCPIGEQTCSRSCRCCDDICGWGPMPPLAQEPCNDNTTALKLAAVPTVKANIQAALNSTINVVALLRNISATGVDPSQ